MKIYRNDFQMEFATSSPEFLLTAASAAHRAGQHREGRRFAGTVVAEQNKHRKEGGVKGR